MRNHIAACRAVPTPPVLISIAQTFLSCARTAVFFLDHGRPVANQPAIDRNKVTPPELAI
jgi:hypothetical protein